MSTTTRHGAPISRPAPRPARLTRRGRLVITLLCAVLLLGAAVGVASSAFGEPGRDAARQVVVEPGDTLWSVARAADPEADPRDTIAAVRELNGLAADAALVPGQALLLPGG